MQNGGMKKRDQNSIIHIENCQVKSLEKAQLLAKLLDQMEKEFGIHEVLISFKNNFICPDMDLTVLSNSTVPMERLIGGVFIKLDKMKYGKKSMYHKQPIPNNKKNRNEQGTN